MSPHNKRHDAKTDANQAQIVLELRQMGFSVETDHDDIFVGKYGINGWFEIKDPHTVLKSTGQVSESEIIPAEKKRLEEWRGHYQIVWETEQIVDYFDNMLKKLEGRN